MKLFPHQASGVDWLVQHPRAALCDEQGLGKTAQLIKALDQVRAVRALIVVPTVVAHNWVREIRMWSPHRNAQLVLTGNTMVDNRVSVTVTTHGMLIKQAIFDQLMAERFDAIVLDEAHYFRNPTALRTRAFFSGRDALCRRAKYCWVATGTPMPNNPTELWSMLAGLAPDRIRGEDGKLLKYSQWRDRFCLTRPTSYGNGIQVIGAKNVEELRQRMQGFMLRRTKDKTLDLPPVRWGTVAVTPADYDPSQKEPDITRNNYEAAFDVLFRSPQFSTWRRETGVAKAPAAVDLLVDELTEAPHKKIVVFAHHTEVVDILLAGLREFGTVEITGRTPAAKRHWAVDQFQTNPEVRVAVCQIVAGGTGITLTAAQDVVFVEQSFVPGENQQAADRCHRIGQLKPVLVRALALAGSVDEVVAEVLTRKTQMLYEVLS